MRFFLLFLAFFCKLSILFSQEQQQNVQRFTAFGNSPIHVPKFYYDSIRKAKTPIEKFSAIKKLTEFHETAGTIDSVIFYGKELFDIAEVTNDDKLLAESYLFIANGKFKKGLFDSALEWYLNGLIYAEKLNDKSNFYHLKIGLALTKYKRGDKKEGIEILNDIIKSSDRESIRNNAKSQLAKFLIFDGKFLEAKKHLEYVLSYYIIEEEKKKEFSTLINLGVVLENLEQYDEALANYTKVFNQSLSHNFFDLYTLSGNNIGNLYRRLKDYENAKTILSIVYANTMQWGNLDAEKSVVWSLQKLHKATGDYKNAYALMTQHERLSKQILTQQNKAQVNELEVKYETLEKEQEITRQKTQKKNILTGFLIVLLPVLGLLYLYYQKLQTQSKLNKTLEEVNKQKVTSLLKDHELKLIKASVEGEERERKRIAKELHDSIGGNLASIKLQISSGNQENILHQIDDTYNQVRDLSHNLMPKKFSDTAFTSLISEYVNTINASSKEDISLHIHPEEEVNMIDETIKIEVYKIIQELLTNAFKHAKASQIDVHISKIDDELKLLFEDNGIGFDKHKTKNGIGFQNISDRLKTINGKMNVDAYPNRGTIIDIDVSLT